jgi:hypothetical protein
VCHFKELKFYSKKEERHSEDFWQGSEVARLAVM